MRPRDDREPRRRPPRAPSATELFGWLLELDRRLLERPGWLAMLLCGLAAAVTAPERSAGAGPHWLVVAPAVATSMLVIVAVAWPSSGAALGGYLTAAGVCCAVAAVGVTVWSLLGDGGLAGCAPACLLGVVAGAYADRRSR